MRKPNQQKIATVQKQLLKWYKKERRVFLWRNTSDPYEILVSEIMLQQTQSSRVQEKLPKFLEQFPDFKSLASATNADVIRAWRGMGYNNRAVRLRQLAIEVINNFDGKLPNTPEILLSLPGIGKYTAHAVTCFGFRKRVPVVDVNIERVLSRLFSEMNAHAEMLNPAAVWSLAGHVLPRDAYSWNQALMELGSTICKARVTRCGECPVNEYCSSSALHRKKTNPLAYGFEKKEKLYNGIPQRIWRGKIVEVLRNIQGHKGISLVRIGKKIKRNFTKDEIGWVEDLVRRLERDGIISIVKVRGAKTVMLAK